MRAITRLRQLLAAVIAVVVGASALVTLPTAVSSAAVSPTITTYAGIGQGDGLAATAAEVYQPYGVATDTNGNVYVTDQANSRVRKINTSGVISLFAGNGVYTSSGDGGLATAAAIEAPYAVATDSSGNVYISDVGTSVIRKVDTSGVITTFAGTGTAGYSGDGGAATSAKLSSPTAMVFDSSGNMYIADQANNRIRKINTSGIISTFAGTGTAGFSGDTGAATSAKLSSPWALALDSSNNLYIADKGNNRVREVTGGTISTFAGNGTASFSGDTGSATAATLNSPRGLAIDGSNNVYIADYSNNRVREVSSGIINTVAGSTSGFSGDGGAATSAKLSNPNALAFSGSSLYISDKGNSRVRKIVSGNISTFAGNGTVGYSGDTGQAKAAEFSDPSSVVFDPAGNAYVADSGNNRIRKITPAGVVSTFAGTGAASYTGDGGLATAATLYYPMNVAIDPSGKNLYVADFDNSVIRRINLSTNIITTVAGNNTQNYSGDGGAATAASLFFPTAVAFDAANNLYIDDSANQVIREVSAGGIITTFAGTGLSQGFSGDNGPATAAQLYSPEDIVFDNSGNLYIADAFNNRVRRVDTSGVITTVAGSAAASVSGDGGAATSAGIPGPTSLAVDTSGNLYIGEQDYSVVRVVNAAGTISRAAGNGAATFTGDGGPAVSAGLVGPSSISLDSRGNLYIADYATDSIRVVALISPAAGSSLVSTIIDPSFTFTVGAHSGVCNGVTQTGSATASAVSLGHANAAIVVTAAQDINVSTNAGSGFSVYLRSNTAVANQILHDSAGHYIADTAGTATSTASISSGSAAFGYTVNATGVSFSTNTFAKVPTSVGNDNLITSATGPTTGSGCVAYAVAIAPTTYPAAYSATVVYTAVPAF